MSSVMSVGEANARVRALRSGKSLVYYKGFLLIDREKETKVDRLANFFLTQGLPNIFYYSLGGSPLAGEDTGSLTQRRLGEQVYEYRFTKH